MKSIGLESKGGEASVRHVFSPGRALAAHWKMTNLLISHTQPRGKTISTRC